MKEIVANSKLIAYCGLYCGACPKFLKGKCNGCAANDKAKWCKVRTCNIEQRYKSCADCKMIDFNECKKLDNFISRVFALVFNSDRMACIDKIKDIGYEKYAEEMAQSRKPSIPRK